MDLTVLIIAAIVALVLYTVGGRFYRFYLFRQRFNKIPGHEFSIPFFGMVYEFTMLPKEDRLQWLKDISGQYKDGFFRVWLGFRPVVYIQKPEHIEVILSSNTQISKAALYEYLLPWLGRGLLTSTGAEWHQRRKFITPSFHFGILEDFAEVMINKAAIFNKCIEREIKFHGDEPFDIFEMGTRSALDIICETAMGTNIHAQEAIESKYIQAVHAISATFIDRIFRPWLKADWIFYRTAYGKSFRAAVDTAQDFCTRCFTLLSVNYNYDTEIEFVGNREKLEERKSGVTVNGGWRANKVMGKQKRTAFLDLMLDANEKEDNPLTIEEMRDETNTLMFAGHDTVGALISWTLFCLGNELDIQKKVHDELDDILGDSDNVTTLKKMPNLKFLERVIKEVLRLYPSIHNIGRTLLEDMRIKDYILPAGIDLIVQIYDLHTNPAVWPNPLRFDPDRFLPENVKTRHPYAYIPFSAGPRNCIGQKYAMLEVKVVLAQILRNFTVKSIEKHSTIKMFSDIILRPVDGIYVNMTKRPTAVTKSND